MNTPNQIIRSPWTGAIAIFILAVVALAPRVGWAQPTPNPPGQISYQGFVTDANGVPLATNSPQNYDIFFHIYDAAQGGNVLWGELQTVTVDKGYFSVLLGQGTSAGDGSPSTNNLTTLFSGATASDRYIGITVRSFAEIQPRLRLLSSPYSLLAANAIGLVGNTGVQVINAVVTNVGINQPPGNDSLDIRGSVGVFGAGTLQFGEDIGGQDPNAGRIGYETFSGNALDIMGAGTTGNRRIKLWAEAGASTTGPLGVNIDTPATKLDVNGGAFFGADTELGSSGGRTGVQVFYNTTADVGVIQSLLPGTSGKRLTLNPYGANVGIGTLTPGATLEVNGNSFLDGYVGILGNNIIEMGRNVAGKEPNAGKIGYGAFTANTLDIVGAGNSGSSRAIKLWAEGGTTMTGGLNVLAGSVSVPNLTTGGSAGNEGVFNMYGFGHLNDNRMYIRGGVDHNHWLGYQSALYDPYYFGYRTFDGPALIGCQGGCLGTTCSPYYGSYVTATMWWNGYGDINVSRYVYATSFYGWSDRNMKTNIVAMDTQDTLAKVAALPVSRWTFTNDVSAEHIGPMAQDFHASFGGLDDKHISLSDETGVALAAIKGLNELVQKQEQEIQVLKQQMQVLQGTVDKMKRVGGVNNQ